VKLCHQHRRLRYFKAADDSVKPFAPANADANRTELRISVKPAERFRDLKWNLKTRAVVSQTAPT